MTPEQYCLEKAAASGSSFYYSFRFLSADKRAAMTALYAFCREVDDVVDESLDTALARRTLDWWREETDRLYAGAPQHPVTQALMPVLAQFPIPAQTLQTIIDGMEMDLADIRYPDFAALKLYCHRVAGVVGEASARIFGYMHADTLEYAALLGLAFQLTNIIRDVGEDARRGRIYLPLDELAQFSVSEQDILHAHSSDAFRELMAFQYRRAQSVYEQAFAALPDADRKTQKTGLVMAAIYRTLLDEIDHGGYTVLTHRTSLPPLRKLWLAWRAWVFG